MTTTNSKIALVTGGSRGLGRNMAISLAQNGVDVVLTYYNNKEKAEEVVKEIQPLGQQAAAFQSDISKVDTFDNFLGR